MRGHAADAQAPDALRGPGCVTSVVYNEANERRQLGRARLDGSQGGASVVLVSDAGMPGLSDPGYRLGQALRRWRGLVVEVVPGPTAAISALAMSGLPPARFVFEGFLPRKRRRASRRLEELRDGAAHARRSTNRPTGSKRPSSDLCSSVWEKRPAALARELTKMHEEVRRGTLVELLQRGRRPTPPKGEIVLVVGGGSRGVSGCRRAGGAGRRARDLMDEGVERKEALQEVARRRGGAEASRLRRPARGDRLAGNGRRCPGSAPRRP